MLLNCGSGTLLLGYITIKNVFGIKKIKEKKIVVLENSLGRPLYSKEIKLVSLKGNQPWIFTERTNDEVEAPILRPPDGKSRLIGKDPYAGKTEERKRRRWQRKMVGWHHWLSGHEFEQTHRDSEGQGSLACCISWGHRVRHKPATEQQPVLNCRKTGGGGDLGFGLSGVQFLVW